MFGIQGRVVAAITLRATMGRKRAFIFAISPLVLVLVTAALKLSHPERASWPADILGASGLTGAPADRAHHRHQRPGRGDR